MLLNLLPHLVNGVTLGLLFALIALGFMLILGLMEPSMVVVSSLDYFDLDAVREVDRDEHGNYRWPFGLELRAAWRFTEPRTALGDISARQFHMDSAQGIVPLLPNEADAILNLPRESVPLLSPLRARVRV